MTPFVVDASLTMSWCFEDEGSPQTEQVLDALVAGQAVVPALWELEVSNVLLVAERRRRTTEAQTARFWDLLASLPIHVDTAPVDVTAVLAAARRHRLTAYNATYLVLAQRLGASLGTLDERLATACREAGVALLLDAGDA